MTAPVPGCAGKRKHASREAAEAKLANHPDQDWKADGSRRYRQLAYECEFCGCWHTSQMTGEQAARQHARSRAAKDRNASIVQRYLKERGPR